MKALTLWQPWATAIMKLGKRIENRPWMPPRPIIDRRIIIHAGKKYEECGWGDYIFAKMEEAGLRQEDCPRGAFIGSAVVTGAYIVGCKDPWFCGPYGWTLKDVYELAKPIPCRGAQGLWAPPAAVIAEVVKQMQGQKPISPEGV